MTGYFDSTYHNPNYFAASGTPGTTVRILGQFLSHASVVAFNGVMASFTVVSDTEVDAVAPIGATTGPISVTTPGGTVVSASNFQIGTALPAPIITTISPTSGVEGAPVVITGTNFTGATYVYFNSVWSASFTVNSATQITATVPTGATSGRVTVVAPGGTATSSATFTVTVTPPPPPPPTDVPAWWGTGSTVTVTTKTVAAIQSAINAASAGQTIALQSGTYTGGGTLTNSKGVRLTGAGLYNHTAGTGTYVQAGYQWGTNAYTDNLMIGNSGTGVHPISSGGSTHAVFNFVRFRGGGSNSTLDLGGNFHGNTAGGWASSVATMSFVNNWFYDCEFENPSDGGNTTSGGIFNIWWDCRVGGAQFHDVGWIRCHIGVKNASGNPGTGRTILFQPSPPEHDTNGPRPSGQPDVMNWSGWSTVDHGAYNITFTDCLVEAPSSMFGSSYYAMDVCDYARSFSLTHYFDSSGNIVQSGGVVGGNPPTAAQASHIPAQDWTRNVTVTRCMFKGGSTVYEFGQNCTDVNCSGASVGHAGSFGNSNSGSWNASTRPVSILFPSGTSWGSSYTPSPFD